MNNEMPRFTFSANGNSHAQAKIFVLVLGCDYTEESHPRRGASIMTGSTQTKQLSVNAAFLKEIKDDNQQLKLLWDRLREAISHSELALNHWPELIQLMSDLRDQLALHFSLEEAYGYFDDAIDVAPQLSLNAEKLRGQHRDLFETACDLADSIVEVTDDLERDANHDASG